MWAAVADVWRLGACVCDDESKIKVVYSQTSKPSTKALAWESEGGEGLKKKKKRENVHPQSIKPQ